MTQAEVCPTDMKVLMNHIYEYQKGVRRMVLFTFNKRYADFALRRLESYGIDYIVQTVNDNVLNLYFGRRECLDAIRLIVTRRCISSLPRRTSYSAHFSAMTSACSANATASAAACRTSARTTARAASACLRRVCPMPCHAPAHSGASATRA